MQLYQALKHRWSSRLRVSRMLMQISMLSLSLLGIYALAFSFDLGPSCKTITTIDTTVSPADAWIDCAENGCTTGCYTLCEMTEYGMGVTCSCSSVNPPRCCHVILVRVSNSWVVLAKGLCSTQSVGCQAGSQCEILNSQSGPYFISTAKCLGGA